jgi:hypothetical protein
MRTIFRVVMRILQLPLWITAFPALKLGMMNLYRGDRLWIPTRATLETFWIVFTVVAQPFRLAWEVIRDG